MTFLDEEQLTVHQMAALKRVTPDTVYRWCRSGRMEHRRTPGGRIYWWESDLDRHERLSFRGSKLPT